MKPRPSALPLPLQLERRPISTGRVVFLTAFFSIFIARYAFDPFFHLLEPLDGSWQFAFTRLLEQGKFLGVDCFYTYGPLAQYLGPLGETTRSLSGIKWGFEAFTVLAFFMAALDLSACLEKINVWARFAAYTMAVALLGAFPKLQFFQENLYDILIVLTYLNFYLASQVSQNRKPLYVLLVLAVALVQFKLSTGFHALGALAIVSTFLAFQRASWRFPVFIALGWLLGSVLFFFILTRHFGFFHYLSMGLKSAAAYNEVQAADLFGAGAGRLVYPVGLLFAAGFLGTGVLFAEKHLARGKTRFFFILNLVFTSFCFFKHGFVRADSHVLEDFYLPLCPLFLLLAALCLIGGTPRQKEFWTPLAFLFIGLQALNSFLQLSGGGNLGEMALGMARDNWINKPGEIYQWVFHPDRVVEDFKTRRDGFLASHYPELSGFLARLAPPNAAPGDKTITFAPWALMLSEAVPQYRLVVPPSLQVYSAVGQPELGRLDRRFLSLPSRPDVVVLGPETSDGRDSMSEIQDWVEPLWDYYRPLGTYDGQSVFRRDDGGKRSIQCFPQGPGLFLRLRMDSIGFGRDFLFRLAETFFKAPEIFTRVEWVDAQGRTRVAVARGYYSQLKEGVYFSGRPAGVVLTEGARENPAAFPFQAVRSAVAIRKPGIENLPVFPEMVPLEVEFCTPQGP